MNYTEITFGRRTSRRRRTTAALGAVALLVAACGADSEDDGVTATTEAREGGGTPEVFGEPAPAAGEPVSIGFIHDGVGPVRDATVDRDVAFATVEYLNEYRSGIAGRPIKLVECSVEADPGRAVDCANEMVQEDVAAVVIGFFSNAEAIFEPIHAAGIPLVVYAGIATPLLTDPDSTFILTNSFFAFADLPISVAQDKGLGKVTVVVIDTPITTSFYRTAGTAYFDAEGIELELVTVAPGTADMTPQMQAIAGEDTLVHVVGTDAFCIAAFDGLAAVGFEGPISTMTQCMTDATREQSDPEILDGMVQQASAPLGVDDPEMALFDAVVETYAPEGTDTTNAFGVAIFSTLHALVDATVGLPGDVTAATVLAAIKAMPEVSLAAGGGVTIQCNGQAVEGLPAICSVSGLRAVLDENGDPISYELVG